MNLTDPGVIAPPRGPIAAVADWSARRWWTALGTAAATVLFMAIPTVLIPNPWFSREIPPTPWAWPVLIVTAALAGLVAATYVAPAGDTRGRGLGSAGALASFFAIGCPVCNKIVLLALGYTGALQWFEPFQPWLAAGSIVLLGAALTMRIRREGACRPR